MKDLLYVVHIISGIIIKKSQLPFISSSVITAYTLGFLHEVIFSGFRLGTLSKRAFLDLSLSSRNYFPMHRFIVISRRQRLSTS